MELYRLIFGKLIWHWLDAAFHWLIFFYVICTASFFIKNKKIFRELKFTRYVWSACVIDILAVILNEWF